LDIDVTIDIEVRIINRKRCLSFLFNSMTTNEMVEILMDIEFDPSMKIDDEIILRTSVYKGVCTTSSHRWGKTRPTGSLEHSINWGINPPPIKQIMDEIFGVISRHVIIQIPEEKHPGIDRFLKDLFENRRKTILRANVSRILNFSTFEEISDAVSHSVVEQVIES
jgi:hypothetical protein